MPECIVGVPKEMKTSEGRVGLTPKCVAALTKSGATVLVESGAGTLSGHADDDYFRAGAVLCPTPEDIWGESDIVVKVKEPIPSEYPLLDTMKKKTLFTYLHLAGVDVGLTRRLLHNEITAIAYENVSETNAEGATTFPLLVPMSKIAGTQAMRAALAHHKGVVPRDLSALIIGGGNVGVAALEKALREGVGTIVLFDAWQEKVRALRSRYCGSTDASVFVFNLSALDGEKVGKDVLASTDIVISGPMVPGGAEAPIVLTQKHFRVMRRGCYIADVSIDQGGSTAWTRGRPTKPGETFVRGARELVFSAVPNIPGSTVPKDATKALTEATFPYLSRMVAKRMEDPHGDYTSLRDDRALRAGLQTWRGRLVNRHVSSAHQIFAEYAPLDTLF